MPKCRANVGVAILLLFALGACSDAAAPPPPSDDPPAQYIALRRAWAPGERDSTIARAKRNHELLFPFVGDLSAYADSIYRDLDSVTVIVANPLYAGAPLAAPGLLMGPRFAGSWNITGVDVLVVNKEVTPNADTLHYIGVFWSTRRKRPGRASRSAPRPARARRRSPRPRSTRPRSRPPTTGAASGPVKIVPAPAPTGKPTARGPAPTTPSRFPRARTAAPRR